MITEAYISGQLGKAIYKDDGKLFLIHNKNDNKPVECDHHDYSLFFGVAGDYEHILYAGTTLKELKKELSFRSAAFNAMTFLIIGMDVDHKVDLKEKAIRRAEEILANKDSFSFARKRLMSCLLPADTDIDRAIEISRRMGAMLTLSVYEEVLRSQPVIGQVRAIWDDVAARRIDGEDEVKHAEGVLFINGIFADFVHAVMTVDVSVIDDIISSVRKSRKLNEQVKGIVVLLYDMRAALIPVVKASAGGDVVGDIDPIEALIRTYNENTPQYINRHINQREVKGIVDEKINYIKQIISQKNNKNLEIYLYDISDYNLNNGGSQFLVMTYCNLATHAMRSHKWDLTERLLDYATLLGIKYPIIWNLRSELFKLKGSLDKALSAYDEAVALFPNDAAARCGRAEVLRELGRLTEALNAYDEAVALFQTNAAARCGRAEVLRELGRLTEALSAYDEAVALFPTNAAVKNGRAGLLLVSNRHAELRESLIIETPVTKDEWTGYHIVAMSYLKEGRELDEAIRRLQYGADNVKWPASRDYFASALALAKMKGKRFGDALNALKKHVVQISDIRNQFYLLLIAHCNIALGMSTDAIDDLRRVSENADNTVLEIVRLIIKRYNLDGNHPLSSAEVAEIDDQIMDMELQFLISGFMLFFRKSLLKGRA
ncbi:MAG: tetratricopeptide repeat protein [Candidatus Magnetobacterium sp. LHC-1]